MWPFDVRFLFIKLFDLHHLIMVTSYRVIFHAPSSTSSVQKCEVLVPQSIQIAGISFQSSESCPPTPSPARECCSSPLLGPKGDTLACRRGGGGNQFRRRNDTLVLYSMYVYYCTVYSVQSLYGGRDSSVRQILQSSPKLMESRPTSHRIGVSLDPG